MTALSNHFLRLKLNEFSRSPFFLFRPQFNGPAAKAHSASNKIFQEFQVSIEEYVVEQKLICQYSADQAVYERTMTRTSDNKVVFEDLYFSGFEYSRPQNHQMQDPSARA